MSLAAVARQPGFEPLLVTLAVLAGQVSIGLSNDAFDAERDRVAGRTDKPIAAGKISRRTVGAAALLALLVSVALCFVIRPAAGVINVVMMAAGWAYNAGLKSTIASGLMYVIGFGAIPVFAASTLPTHATARLWGYAVAALLGLGGQFTNVLYDLDADERSGVRGLPQRVAAASPRGPMIVRLIAFALLLTASAVVAAAQWDDHRWLAVTGPALVLLVALVGLRGSGKVPFVAALGIAVLNVGILVLGAPLIVA